MKMTRVVAMLGATVIFMCCFTAVSMGFNPQPEPPATDQMNETIRPLGNAAEPVGLGPEGITETNPDNIKIIPTMQGTYTDTKPVSSQGLQGSPVMMEPSETKAMEPLDKSQAKPGMGSEKMEEDEEPAHQRSPKMIDPVDDGKPVMPGSAKMDEIPDDEEAPPADMHSPKMMDQGDGGSPGGPKMKMPDDSPGNPKMMEPGNDEKPAMSGATKMEDPGEGPTPGVKTQKRMNKQMQRY